MEKAKEEAALHVHTRAAQASTVCTAKERIRTRCIPSLSSPLRELTFAVFHTGFNLFARAQTADCRLVKHQCVLEKHGSIRRGQGNPPRQLRAPAVAGESQPILPPPLHPQRGIYAHAGNPEQKENGASGITLSQTPRLYFHTGCTRYV